MNRIDNSSIQEMAAQIKAMAAQASPAKPAGGADSGGFAGSKVDFGDVLKATPKKLAISPPLIPKYQPATATGIEISATLTGPAFIRKTRATI